MRPRHKPPLNRRYFHTKPKIDKRDIYILKRKNALAKQKKNKRDIEERLFKRKKY